MDKFNTDKLQARLDNLESLDRLADKLVNKTVDDLRTQTKEMRTELEHAYRTIEKLSKQDGSKLSSAELERLALLAEEASEVVHIVGKIIRHGYESYNPKDPKTNRSLLERELADFAYAVGLLMDNNDVYEENVSNHYVQKLKKINPYLHHN